MENLKIIQQTSKESHEETTKRVLLAADLNLAEAFARKKRESATEHARRFIEWYDPINNDINHPDNNIDDTFFNKPRVGDTNTQFQNRIKDFYGKRNELLVEADKELLNLIQRRPKETLQIWLDRVKAIMLNNSDLIDIPRIDETYQEFHDRRERFYSMRESIVSEISVELYKGDRKKNIEDNEKVTFAVRKAEKKKEEKEEEKAAKKREIEEKAAEEAENLLVEKKKAFEKKTKEDRIKYKIFILMILLYSMCFSVYTCSMTILVLCSLLILSLLFKRVKKEVLGYKPMYCLLSAIYFVYIKLK